ncbi:hypothetical protein B0H16DRAFT_1467508 [Mycena metata]|uniref:Uncharacterized protein n=1 Tax=Mycena metata TaxID=1033252 RepID=A0AAD7I449_9AGAR|nr:hypothetical protein B0H16DRAFT_1467508 [Mycena metata]
MPSTTDFIMLVVLLPLTIVRSAHLTLAVATPRTFASISTSPTPPIVRIPLEFYGPWFLTKYGILVLDKDPKLTGNTRGRAFDQSEEGESPQGGVFEQADSPCFAASDFETIITFLLLVPDLANNFWRVDGCFVQYRALYFIVEEHQKFFTCVLEAQLYHIETGDPTLGIYVLPTHAQAEAMLDPDNLIAVASA